MPTNNDLDTAARRLINHLATTTPVVERCGPVEFVSNWHAGHYTALFTGERTLARLACDLWNGSGGCTVEELLRNLDGPTLRLALRQVHQAADELSVVALHEAVIDVAGRLSDAVDALPIDDPRRSALLQADALAAQAKGTLTGLRQRLPIAQAEGPIRT